jgi:hypothetical protein
MSRFPIGLASNSPAIRASLAFDNHFQPPCYASCGKRTNDLQLGLRSKPVLLQKLQFRRGRKHAALSAITEKEPQALNVLLVE